MPDFGAPNRASMPGNQKSSSNLHDDVGLKWRVGEILEVFSEEVLIERTSP